MNLILLGIEDFIDSHRVRLTGRRFTHARQVLSVTNGKTLQVGLLGGKTGTGTVLRVDMSSLELEVRLEFEPPEPLPISVILAMPRPKVLKRVLQGLTAMGVKNIILLNTWRVDKSYWQSSVLDPTEIRKQFILGLEQGCDTVLPKLQLQPRFKPFVEDSLPELATGTCALVAHPLGSQPCPADVRQPVTLAIGPEGGLTSYEIARLTEAGLSSVQLGCRPLRVETAIPALLGRLMCCH
ncbi:MAG: 16S rRNA (uracil(1498)-N(3))-methyltransferase [Desulfuromonadales bacterium]